MGDTVKPDSDPDPKHFDRLPRASGGIARLAYARARQSGLDVDQLLKRASLTVREIEDRQVRFPVQKQIRLLTLVAAALPDDLLGFHLAQNFEMGEIGLLYYTMASSATVGEALQRAARYSTIANEGVVMTATEADDLAIGFGYVGVARHSDRHQIEFWLTAVVRSCRELTGLHVVPRAVEFLHHRNSDYSEMNNFFGTKVAFGADRDALAFQPAVRDLPIISADPYLNELLVKYCEDALARRAVTPGPLRLAVANAIAQLLPHGGARLPDIARKLGVSARTLARRLAAEGLSFGHVLDDLRCELAQRYVREANLSFSEIAWLLGYQEVSAFTHAFKRWTGMTPRRMRALAAERGV